MAHKGWESNALRNQVTKPRHSARGSAALEPQGATALQQEALRKRKRIACGFSRLQDFRLFATHFDRNAKNFVAALCLAAVVIGSCSTAWTPALQTFAAFMIEYID